MKQPITIEYITGEKATYTAHIPEFAKWERETGKTIADLEKVMGLWDLMFLAYHAHKREAAGKPVKSFEIWSEGVVDLSTKADESPKLTSQEA